MTNLSSGSKRSWEGVEHDSYKRPREDSRNWRDIHLKSPSSKHQNGHRGGDRRSYSDYRTRDSDSRERSRRSDVDTSSRRNRDRPSSRYRSPESPLDHRENSDSKVDSEKEEGEISPPPRSAPLSTLSKSPVTQESLTHPPPTADLPDMEVEIASSPPPVELTLAARRVKRQAIMAKYTGVASSSASPRPVQTSAVQPPHTAPIEADPMPTSTVQSPTNLAMNRLNGDMQSKRPPVSASPSPTPVEFEVTKNDEQESVQVKVQAENTTIEQVSAADYDPNQDRRHEEERRARAVKEQSVDGFEEIIKQDDEEDVDDMFALTSGGPEVKKAKKIVKKSAAPALITTTLDSASDHEGYYQVILGEQLDGGRYQVFSSLGKGMFANVVRARIISGEPGETAKEVAIKIIRSQESMYRAGQKEIQILSKLNQADPDDKKHIVRLERSFEHRGHLCMVFESLSMNLREVVKRFGKDVGLNIKAVRAYAHQLFLALGLLKKLNVIHADIKPDNILANESKTVLKLCDLGSASDASENEIMPYLVSRFYRAPEIILGVPYDGALDVWSIGCTLYELFTGKILFPGRSNNQMLLHMMELKGRFNSKMIKKAKFGDVFFDEMGGFNSVEPDRVTGADVIRKVHVSKPAKDLKARLMPSSSKLNDDENKMMLAFVDLLDKCLTLDPARRITPREALSHSFVRG